MKICYSAQKLQSTKRAELTVMFHRLKGAILSKKAIQKNRILGLNLFKQLPIQLIS